MKLGITVHPSARRNASKGGERRGEGVIEMGKKGNPGGSSGDQKGGGYFIDDRGGSYEEQSTQNPKILGAKTKPLRIKLLPSTLKKC